LGEDCGVPLVAWVMVHWRIVISCAIAEVPLVRFQGMCVSPARLVLGGRGALEEPPEGEEAGHADAEQGHRGRFRH
jgi:hypothetical protein